MENLSTDFKERVSDFKQRDFKSWMMQPMLVDLSDISNSEYQKDIAELQK